MNSKNYLKSLIAILLIAVFFVSCEDDEVKMPEISNLELGYDNSRTGYLGSDLHIDADIIAENRIDRIVVEIHYEGDHHHKKSFVLAHSDHEWEFEHTYTEFQGLKNTKFHEHIDIPLDVKPGEYHFHFKVIDMEGYTAEIEEDLEISEPEVTEVPVITVTSAPQDNQVFSDGQTISISGNITHSLGVGGLYIGIVRSDTDYTDAEVNSQNSITLLHTHDFDDPKNVQFDVSLDVGAEFDNNITPKEITGDIAWQTGDYSILVKSRGVFGGPFGFSDRYNIKIEL